MAEVGGRRNTFNLIETQGLKYAGSKLKLLPNILEMVQGLPIRRVFDGFSGTTRVSQAFAQNGFSVVSNDVSAWSKVFGQCFLQHCQPKAHYQKLIDHLNALSPQEGWFTEHYGGHPEQSLPKRPFQVHNTQKLDAIREEIDRLNLAPDEKAVALASLMLALDKVDNTLGHYAAYLAKWSARSYQQMKLELPRLFPLENKHEVHQGDIFETLPKVEADLAYYDPPYGSNNAKMPPSRVRYAAYYHLWTTIALNDRPKLFGKAGRREDSRDKVAGSVFEDFRQGENGEFVAMDAIRKLIEQSPFPFILLSYSSGGRATKEELYDILNAQGGKVKVAEVDYKKNVMSTMSWTGDWVANEAKNLEYLFLLER